MVLDGQDAAAAPLLKCREALLVVFVEEEGEEGATQESTAPHAHMPGEGLYCTGPPGVCRGASPMCSTYMPVYVLT